MPVLPRYSEQLTRQQTGSDAGTLPSPSAYGLQLANVTDAALEWLTTLGLTVRRLGSDANVRLEAMPTDISLQA